MKKIVRRVDADQYLFNILITAIATVLLTRLYLTLTGFPTLGGDFLHIAHVLWGGLFMLVASIFSIGFHGKKVRIWASILAGMGFGLFIDEVGKFVTHDNNYFFEPAIVIMYLMFILLFLFYSWTKKKNIDSPKGLLYNSLELFEEILEGDFETHEKKKLLEELNQVIKSKEKNHANFAKKLKSIVAHMRTIDKNETKLHKFWNRARNLHKYFGKKPLFAIMTILLAINGISSIISGIFTLIKTLIMRQELLQELGVESLNNPLVYATGISLLSAIVSAGFVVRGVYLLFKKQRYKALHLFKIGLLIRILITHLFTFYFEQFAATLAVLLDILFYFAVEFLLQVESEDLNKKQLKKA